MVADEKHKRITRIKKCNLVGSMLFESGYKSNRSTMLGAYEQFWYDDRAPDEERPTVFKPSVIKNYMDDFDYIHERRKKRARKKENEKNEKNEKKKKKKTKKTKKTSDGENKATDVKSAEQIMVDALDKRQSDANADWTSADSDGIRRVSVPVDGTMATVPEDVATRYGLGTDAGADVSGGSDAGAATVDAFQHGSAPDVGRGLDFTGQSPLDQASGLGGDLYLVHVRVGPIGDNDVCQFCHAIGDVSVKVQGDGHGHLWPDGGSQPGQ